MLKKFYSTMSRAVVKNIESVEQGEGMGARVRRSIGGREVRNFDPFLMLDEARVKAPAGFPDHPHRGFETVSYMLKGQFQHEDFAGHKGILSAGDLQWMTAGRGIVHGEMPYGTEDTHGLQLWVNLSKANKMVEPAYQELKSSEIPEKSENGVHVRIIAGESMGVKAPIYTRTPTMYLDFKLDPKASFTQSVPSDWNAFVYILSGQGVFGSSSTIGLAHHTLIFNKGDSVSFRNDSNEQLHFVFLAGQPLNEPIVQHGPFVMNTQDEIRQAIIDYQLGKNGFEKAKKWESEAYKKLNSSY